MSGIAPRRSRPGRTIRLSPKAREIARSELSDAISNHNELRGMKLNITFKRGDFARGLAQRNAAAASPMGKSLKCAAVHKFVAASARRYERHQQLLKQKQLEKKEKLVAMAKVRNRPARP